MSTEPLRALDKSPMSWLQVRVVAIAAALNALDGFDVLSISFAGPGIAQTWGIDRAALGVVLSMELVGMGVGSLVLGNLADKIGRRHTVLGCLMLMTVGMFMVTTANSLLDLSVWRVLTGLGIGGMLATTNAITAEFSNAKRRHLNIAIMGAGYPLGAVLGGAIVAQLLETRSWESIFYFGAAVTAAFIPIVWFLVPESAQWLARTQPRHALDRINRALSRLGHAQITVLPAVSATVVQGSLRNLFAIDQVAKTLAVSAAFFFHMLSFYFLMKWIPKIVVDVGFAASAAAGVLVWTTVGGALGSAVLGLATQKADTKKLTIGAMLLSALMIAIFGWVPGDLQLLSIVCAAAGFSTNAAIGGMYALFAEAFPTHIRASGTGFAIGTGRGGAVLGPILAGYLFEYGVTLPSVTLAMAIGPLIAAGCLVLLRLQPPHMSEPVASSSSAQPTLRSVLGRSRTR